MRRIGWVLGVYLLLLFGFAGQAWANEIRVCVRPPNVPANVERWAYSTGTASLMTTDTEVFSMRSHGQTIYVFDPSAPEENAKLFPMPFNKLRCAARVLPKKELEPPKLDPKKDDAAGDEVAPGGTGNGVKKGAKADGGDAPVPLPQPLPQPPREEHRPSQWPKGTMPGEVLPRKTVLPFT